jgi:3-oxoacyl-[acyl-carrier protein] reductase
LAAEGAKLASCSRDAAAIEQVGREIASATGAEVLARAADVSRTADVAAFVDATLARFGRVDILLTNSGGPPAGRFETLDAAAWQKAAELTLFAPVEFARRVLPGMKERRWGRILNVTSLAVKQPVENLMLSNSLRAAVTGWARTLANEVGSFGVTVNSLMPGYTRTERVVELSEVVRSARASPRSRRWRWEREVRSAGSSRASSRRSPRSSPRSARATSPASRSRWTAAGSRHCCRELSRARVFSGPGRVHARETPSRHAAQM